jgi:phage shock protein PspC (stress-responsive transcriptional regulator)
MEPRRTTFYLDKANAKWLGVCSGIAEYTGIDLTVIRIVTVLSTIFLTGGTLIFAYLIIAWMAPVKPYGLYENADEAKFWQGLDARRTLEIPRHRPATGGHRNLLHQPQFEPRQRDRQPALSGGIKESSHGLPRPRICPRHYRDEHPRVDCDKLD